MIALFTEAERLGRLQAAESAFALGLIEESALDWNAAYNHYKRAYNFDNDNPQYAHAYAIIASRMGRYPEAVQIFETALQQVRDAGQEGTEDHAKALNNLAYLHTIQGGFARAEPMYEEALSIHRRVLGTDHPDTASSLNNLASLYYNQGDLARAKPMYEEAIGIMIDAFPDGHPDADGYKSNYWQLLKQLRD